MEQVEVEVGGDLAADLDPADAVAVRVQRRRVDGDPELPRQHREDAAGDAALGRHADVDHPLPRRVVHPAGRHHAQHPVDVLALQRPLAGQWMDAAVGQRRRHQAEVAAVDRDRALAEVEVERRLGVALEDAEAAQHVADRAVAVAGVALGLIDRGLDLQRAPGEAGVGAEQALLALGGGVTRDQ